MGAMKLFVVALWALPLPPLTDEPEDGRHAFPELGLEVDLRRLAGLEQQGESRGDVLGVWQGDLGESEVRIQISVGPLEFAAEPEDVTDYLVPFSLDDLVRYGIGSAGTKRSRKREEAPPSAAYLWPGPFGAVPYASIRASQVSITSDRVYESYILGAVLPEKYYTVEVECRPPLDVEMRGVVHDFLRNGFTYEGPLRDHRWTDEEVQQRWVSSAPDEMHDKLKKPIRTDHYIILGNSSGGKLFAKKMEECYDEIRKVFPFDEIPDRRLMPVFVFTTPDQYYDFLVKNGMPRERAEETAGVAYGDLYATWYAAPGDPVHIHEATHQIFGNRLRLPGAGSWFQEGVAEYMSTRSSERRSYAKGRAKRRTQVPFDQFFTLASLIRGGGQDEKKGEGAHDNYLQAASIIEFARESRFGKDRFDLFLRAVGIVPRGDLKTIEEVLLEVYEVDVAGFEDEWVEYWR